MQYRKEIDGLRAIAVLSVVFYHAKLNIFPGGFVGVDVFFVISGYLITSILLAENQAGTFSLSNFYERRARRILPALFVVMLVSLPAAWLWLWPSDFRDYAKSLVYVSLFASNVHFYKEIGYFEPDVELRPLLHTWSLAVEEQYYIIFPLLMLLGWKLGKQRMLLVILSALAAASLVYAEIGSHSAPEASFYLLPTRAWELLAGALLAFIAAGRQKTIPANPAIGEVGSGLGLILVLCSALLFDSQTPYPGVNALPPTLGAVLIIAFAAPQTFVGRLLGSGPLVAIGLSSYSIYLWHQPLFALAKYISPEEPDRILMITLVALTLLLAHMTWRYVETPFRNRAFVSRRRVIQFGSIATIFFLAVGLIGKQKNDFWSINTAERQEKGRLEGKLERNHGLHKSCGEFGDISECQSGENPEVLVWGDSYAMHLVDGIISSNPKVSIAQKTRSVCGPFFGVASMTHESNTLSANNCLAFNDHVSHWIDQHPTIKHVVLGSPFSQYLLEDRYLLLKGADHPVATNFEVVHNEFLSTLRNLRSRRINVIVFAPPPANNTDIGKCLARSEFHNHPLDRCNFDISQISSRRQQAYRLLSEIEKEFKVIWLHREMCRTGTCESHSDSIYYFRDGGHLSREGSAAIGKQMDFYRLITEK